MRICITTSDRIDQVGGSEWSVRRISDFLADGGWEVHIACLDLDTTGLQWDTPILGIAPGVSWRDDVRVHVIHKVSGDLGLLFEHRAIAAALERLHRVYRFDLFHAFFLSTAGFLTTLVAKRLGVPVVASARGSDIDRDVFSPVRLASIRYTLEQADHLTFVSQDMRRTAELIADCSSRSSVILNSTQVDYFDEAPRPLAWESGRFVIGCAGTMSYKKNWPELLEVCRRLRYSQVPVRLLWIGDAARSEKDLIQAAIAELGLADVVTLTGAVGHAQMGRYLNAIDAFVLLSLNEGCPNALLEAMLYFRPIVAYAVGAIPELIRDGIDGAVKEPTTIEAIVDLLARLYGEPERAAAWGRSAGARVRAAFTPKIERAQWMECYAKVVDTHARRH
jgi:glycosyltransferase involved in cell wall biosynthesis